MKQANIDWTGDGLVVSGSVTADTPAPLVDPKTKFEVTKAIVVAEEDGSVHFTLRASVVKAAKVDSKSSKK